MSNGRLLGERNLLTFVAWVASKTDQEFRSMTHRGALSRTEIAKECGFAKSALDQNPRIKALLRELEEGLRGRGVLPPAVAEDSEAPAAAIVREPSPSRAVADKERLSRLEQENAALRAEVAELKRAVERLGVLREALASTGRVPR